MARKSFVLFTAVFALLIVANSCNPPSALLNLPINARRIDCREAIGLASLIVSGRISDISWRPDLTRKTESGTRVIPWIISIDEVQVLKGRFSGTALNYILYNYEPGHSYNSGFELCARGDRRLFFLSHSGSYYRAVADLFPTTVLLRTDTSAARPNVRATLQEALGRLILMPSGSTSSDAAAYLESNLREALKCTGYALCDELTRALLNDSDSGIRLSVCLARYSLFLSEDDCSKARAPQATKVPESDPLNEARRRREVIRQLIARAVRSGSESPLKARVCADPQSASLVTECLEFFSRHPDHLIQRSAQLELSRIATAQR